MLSYFILTFTCAQDLRFNLAVQMFLVNLSFCHLIRLYVYWIRLYIYEETKLICIISQKSFLLYYYSSSFISHFGKILFLNESMDDFNNFYHPLSQSLCGHILLFNFLYHDILLIKEELTDFFWHLNIETVI